MKLNQADNASHRELIMIRRQATAITLGVWSLVLGLLYVVCVHHIGH